MEVQALHICKEGRDAMETLVQLRDGDAALLYAFLATCQEEGAAAPMIQNKLGFSPEQTEKACQLLLVFGLASRRRATPPPRDGANIYPASELAEARTHDPAFDGLCTYLETELGRILNRQELETLLNVRDSLNLPESVLTLLISDCASRGKLSARMLEKQAYHWYDLELNTYERASAYLKRQQELATRGVHVLALFQIRGRLPGETEQKYIDQWTEWGFSDEMLKLAYDRTLLGTGRLTWPYLHRVLSDWHASGFRTPADVERERKVSSSAAASAASIAPAAESLEHRILRQMQQKRQARAVELEERRAWLREQCPEFGENETALRLCASRRVRETGERRKALEAEYRTYQQKQLSLLAQMGKPSDWLTDKPDCPLCGDHGYIGTKKCQCLQKACEKAGAGK